MKHLVQAILLVCVVTLTAVQGVAVAETTNASPALTREELSANLLQVQAQIHAAQLAAEQAQTATLEAAHSNADMLAGRIHALEQSLAEERQSTAESTRKSQQNILLMAGGFGLAVLGLLFAMVYFQWRSMQQIAQVATQSQAALANAGAVHQLAAPGRAAVEVSNARLLDVVSHLEKKIMVLEAGNQQLTAGGAGGAGGAGDELATAQAALEAGQAAAALPLVEQFLARQGPHAGALLKKAAACEQLGRLEEAVAACDQALAKDARLKAAWLQKGGLLNKLNRHAEAIDCFEQALRVPEKSGRTGAAGL